MKVSNAFTHRLAVEDDLPALTALAGIAIEAHLADVLDATQVALSRSIMGIDAQLVTDRTYFVVEDSVTGRMAGCGGWSWRTGGYGGGHSTPERDAALQAMEPDTARVRAMYTHPDFKRRGVGRLILDIAEQAARAAGFRRVELMATASGEPLYRACGYEPVQRFIAASHDGVDVPGVRMVKDL